MVKGNPDIKFLLDVTLHGYRTDSIPSDPDLTEIIIDTLHYSVSRQVVDTVKLDSLLIAINEQSALAEVQSDSSAMAIDTTFMSQIDAVRKTAFKIILVDSIAIKKTYHNNRTQAQVKNIIAFLLKEGVTAQNLSYSNKAIPESIPENRKTKVKVIVIE
ncbi:hypothetical protein MASR2M41_13620 [Flammeovirgaceae bacterium]